MEAHGVVHAFSELGPYEGNMHADGKGDHRRRDGVVIHHRQSLLDDSDVEDDGDDQNPGIGGARAGAWGTNRIRPKAKLPRL